MKKFKRIPRKLKKRLKKLRLHINDYDKIVEAIEKILDKRCAEEDFLVSQGIEFLPRNISLWWTNDNTI